MTSNPDITITRDQIPAVDRPKNTDAEKAFFQGVGADVPELSPYESEEVDLLFREMEELGAEEAFSRRSDLFDATRGDVAAFEKKLETEGGHYESLAKDIAANRRAEEAGTLAQELKEINERKREPFKQAARNLLLRLETAPAAKIKDETLERKAAKAQKQADTKGRRAAFFKNLGQEITHFGTTAENRREAVREALRAGYRPPEKLAKPQPEQAKPKEPELTIETLLPQLEGRLQTRLKDTQEAIRKIYDEDRALVDRDELGDLEKLARVIESDLKAMEADKKEGEALEASVTTAEAELAAEEAKLDKTAIEKAHVEVETAQRAFEQATTARKELKERAQADAREIAQLEKQLRETRRGTKRPVEIHLETLRTHALGIRDALLAAQREESTAEEALGKKQDAHDDLRSPREFMDATNKLAAAKTHMKKWGERQPDKNPVMIAAQNEWKRLEQEHRTQKEAEEARRTAAIESRFEGAKGEALDKTLSRLSDKQLEEQVKAFEGVAANEPGNPVLAEMATRYKREADRRHAEAEAKKAAAEAKPLQDRREEATRERDINTFKVDYAFHLGKIAGAKEMAASLDAHTAFIGTQALESLKELGLKKQEAKLQERYKELGADIALNTIKPRPLSNAERERWEKEYGAKEGVEIEGEPTPEETEEITARETKEEARWSRWEEKLNKKTTQDLERMVKAVRERINKADVPDTEDTRTLEIIQRILSTRLDKSPGVSEVPDKAVNEVVTTRTTTEQLEAMRKTFQTKLETDTVPDDGDVLRLDIIDGILQSRLETPVGAEIEDELTPEEAEKWAKYKTKEAQQYAESEERSWLRWEEKLNKKTTKELEEVVVVMVRERINKADVPDTGDTRTLEIIQRILSTRLDKSPGVSEVPDKAVNEVVTTQTVARKETEARMDAEAERIRKEWEAERAAKAVPKDETSLTEELAARTQSREESEDTTAVLARAKALFKETPVEKPADEETSAA